MAQVTELGYVGLGVRDLDAWKDFAANIVGLEVSDEGERDRCYLRMDYWHHRFVLQRDQSDDLLYLGFRVAGAQEFHEMQAQLESAGIKYRVGSTQDAAERRVLEVMKLEDPDGNPIEIFHGPEVLQAVPFHPGRRMHGRFKTDTGGLGHCILRERDPEAACRFYRTLGMRGGIEYRIRMGGNVLDLMFMHCNDRDHTVAFGVGDPRRRLNHVMLECESFDDVGMTYDLVRSRNIPVAITPGKHSNDHMYSFYFRNPSGWMFEYGWGGRPATFQSEYYLGDMYGHQPESGGFGPPPESK
jgi:2,3-dihydroxybiphenyl 1,2-dioxygenase